MPPSAPNGKVAAIGGREKKYVASLGELNITERVGEKKPQVGLPEASEKRCTGPVFKKGCGASHWKARKIGLYRS